MLWRTEENVAVEVVVVRGGGGGEGSWEVELMLEDLLPPPLPRPLFINKRLVYKQPSESKQVNFTKNLTENQYKKDMFAPQTSKAA